MCLIFIEINFLPIALKFETSSMAYIMHQRQKKPQESSDFYFVEFMAMAGLVTVS